MNAVTRKLSHLAESFAVYKERAQQMLNDIVKAPSVSQKLKQFQRGAFEIRLAHFLIKGYLNDAITPYDDDFNQELKNNAIRKMSVATIIYDFNPDANRADTVGYCYERSFLMFMCVDKALWVRGHNKSLELAHSKENASHAWVEIGDHVYDPTTLLKYQKDLYYKMLKVTDVIKLSHQDVKNQPDTVKNLMYMLDDYLRTIQGQLSSQNRRVTMDK